VTQAIVGSSRPSVAGLLERVKPKTSDRFLASAQKSWQIVESMLDEKADSPGARIASIRKRWLAS